MKKITLFLIVLVLVVAVVIFLWQFISKQLSEDAENTPEASFLAQSDLISEVYYSCNDGKQIKASYYKGEVVAVNPGEMPVPTGKVFLALSDDRKMILPQTISASGIRYANNNESIIFWSKGESAFITENNSETFSNCAERIWKIGSEHADAAVREFLLTQKQISWETEAGSEKFCVFQNLAPEGELFPYYLWIRCSEYKIEDGELKELSGTSVPVKVDYPNELSYYDLNKFSISIPRDGSLYDEDVKVIFPEEIWDRLHFESRPLNELIVKEALKYFASAECFENSKYFVIHNGFNFLIKYKINSDQKLVCEYSAEEKDFEIRDLEATYFLTLTDNFLILDFGTAPPPRKMIVYDLNSKKEVYSDKYAQPVQTEGDTITYWSPVTEKPTTKNCPSLAEYSANGLGAVIEVEVTLNLSNLTKKELGERRCEATQ